MEFRWHPILEGLKVNEDGSVIIYQGQQLSIKTQKLAHTRKERKIVNFNRKTVHTIRLVLESWVGMPENKSYAARRVDENAGDHYSNLYWGKAGMTKSSVIGHAGVEASRKIDLEKLNEIETRRANGEKLTDILKEIDASNTAYYRAKKRYGKN